ncbi:SAP domain-containing protein [Cladophialophora immunda]|nr:SAP domain-containing protein [Cladophialophora immunda]
MVDYSKKTVVELIEILKSRSLPHSGKKAELVARLNEADKAAEENETEKAPPAESTTAQPAPAPESSAAPAPAPETTSEEPAATELTAAPASVDEKDSPSANTDTALANSTSYALNLPQSDVDSEMAKRKARAERFGTSAAPTNGETETNATDGDAQKALERARRFGTGQTAVGKLDEALPEERERGSRKRGRTEETGAMDDPGLRKSFGGRGARGRGGRFRGRGGRDNSRRRTGEKPSGVTKQGVFSTDADRAAAEARKKKFGTAS